MPDDAKHDQEFVGSQFTLEIGGVELGRFQAVSGLNWETEVIEFKDTTKEGKVIIRKRPGQTKYPDVTFKRGMSADGALLKWYQTVMDGKVERKEGSIVVYDLAGDEIDRWNFEARMAVEVERVRPRGRQRLGDDRRGHHGRRAHGTQEVGAS